MIIPTPEFDPMFAEDGVPFREKMIDYIRREMAEELGPRTSLLLTDEGLQSLSQLNSDSESTLNWRTAAA